MTEVWREPLWRPCENRSLLQVKLNDVSEGLNVKEIASNFTWTETMRLHFFELGDDVSLGFSAFSRHFSNSSSELSPGHQGTFSALDDSQL